MSLETRMQLIRELERARNSRVLTYVTSTRPQASGMMSEDQVRVVIDHLLAIGKVVPRLDIFIISNGGSPTVAWRLVSLFREYCKHLGALIPQKAYSAASMLALGADEIVMGPFGEMGPIDPKVTNEFNPIDPQTQQRMGISVEDVRAYVQFVKHTVGITHEDELVQAFKLLAEKVHPLALGNVERFLSQSRMMAAKIMKTHARKIDDRKIKDIVENMISKLYFHAHPINRKEAVEDLELQVAKHPPVEVEKTMWTLFTEYERDMELNTPHNPALELLNMDTKRNEQQAPPATDSSGMLLPAEQAPPITKTYDLSYAMIESTSLASRYCLRKQSTLIKGPQPQVQEQLISSGWESTVPESIATPAPRSESPQGPTEKSSRSVRARSSSRARRPR